MQILRELSLCIQFMGKLGKKISLKISGAKKKSSFGHKKCRQLTKIYSLIAKISLQFKWI